MRYVIALVCCVLLSPTQAQACLGPFAQTTLFFETIPNPRPDADVIAEVVLLEVSDFGFSTAEVLKIFSTSDERIRAGRIVTMRYPISSCGPSPKSGKKGKIIAKAVADSNGSLVFHPYIHRPDDGHIFAPRMLPNGFGRRPMHVKIGKSIPQDFAVMLIGVVGSESVDSLRLTHSEGEELSGFNPQSNTIVAIAIPVGTRKLSISSARIVLRGEGYRTNSAAVNTPTIDIDRPGFYYVTTLNTDHPGQFRTPPLPEQLAQFRADYAGTLKKLEPINFRWPSRAND